MKTVVINLDKKTERLKTFDKNAKLLSIQYERFSAINGRTLDRNSLTDEVEKQALSISKKPGEVGCFLSHYRLWKLAAETNSYIVVFEDDVHFCKSATKFTQTIQSILESKFNDFDLLYFGGRFRPNFIPSKGVLSRSYKKLDFPGLYRKKSRARSNYLDRTTHGYVISPSGGQKMVEFSKTIYKQKKPQYVSDDALERQDPRQFKIYDIFPHFTFSPRDDADSDIKGERLAAKSLNSTSVIIAVTVSVSIIIVLLLLVGICLSIKRKRS
jgi:GR25 family glycosyltransferase involved in LPS biosynthesis